MRPNLPRLLCTCAFFAAATLACAQSQPSGFPPRRPAAPPAQRQAAQPPQPLRKASDLIRKQEPIKIDQKLINQVRPDQVRIVVSLPKQRAYLISADRVVIDSPISSGKRGHGTPSGNFTVLEKDANHHSNLYGDFVDRAGRVVRAGVSARIDSAPSGTHFVGAPMKWFMRLTDGGVGMHVGILPGYPASHGCVRMPPDAAKLFYDRVKVGTPVDVGG